MNIKQKIERFLKHFPRWILSIFMNNKFVLSLFSLVIVVISVIFIDTYILPKTTIVDTIDEIKELVEKSTETNEYKRIGYKCKTGEDFVFYIKYARDLDLITDRSKKIQLEHTLLLKNVIAVKSKKNDYSDQLFSNTINELKYFYLLMLLSLIVNILIIYFDISIKRNSLWNFIGVNFMLIVIWLVLESLLKFQTPLFEF